MLCVRRIRRPPKARQQTALAKCGTCMYVCMCVCMYVCMHVCMYVGMQFCLSVYACFVCVIPRLTCLCPAHTRLVGVYVCVVAFCVDMFLCMTLCWTLVWRVIKHVYMNFLNGLLCMYALLFVQTKIFRIYIHIYIYIYIYICNMVKKINHPREKWPWTSTYSKIRYTYHQKDLRPAMNSWGPDTLKSVELLQCQTTCRLRVTKLYTDSSFFSG